MADEEPIPSFIKPVLTLPDGTTYTITKPLTNYRSCHDGTPQEARMVFLCTSSNTEYVMKVKVQLPSSPAHPGPSTTTAHELDALRIFTAAGTPFAPHLVASHTGVQDDAGPNPGGFITYTIMTLLPGFALFGKFWNMSTTEREEIVPKAVEALRAIYALGVEPGDRGMRNVIWDPVGRTVGIIDFELWDEVRGTFADEKREMQRWGLVRTPPAKDHFIAFNAMYRS